MSMRRATFFMGVASLFLMAGTAGASDDHSPAVQPAGRTLIISWIFGLVSGMFSRLNGRPLSLPTRALKGYSMAAYCMKCTKDWTVTREKASAISTPRVKHGIKLGSMTADIN
jgi:hypothetical protein